MNDQVPLEFNLLFDSLKLEIKTPADKIRMIGLCKDLNDNIGNLKKEQIFMLMKTEVIKGVLDFKFSKLRQFDVNTMLITRLEQDYDSKKKYLNSFSRWIWQSMIAELNHRKKMGIITSSTLNPNLFEGQKRNDALRFERYLNYMNPWIDKMDSLDASAFNKLSKEVSWAILERINDRSQLFKRYASTSTGENKTAIFNIPQKLLEMTPEEIKEMQKDETPLTLSEQSKKIKVEATTEMEKVTPLDMSTVSEDVSQELDKKIQSDKKTE
jgi:hypothetical protein